nr:MFS transporter [Microbispora sp. H10885]
MGMLSRPRRDPSLGEPAGASGTALAVAMVVALFLTESLVQILLPVGLEASGAGSGLLIGVLLALAQGAGVVMSPPAALRADRHGRGGVLFAGGLVLAGCAAGLAAATSFSSAWIWVLPLLGYGLARGSVVTTTLAVVARSGDRYRTQGLNGAAQRLSAAVAATLSVVLLAHLGTRGAAGPGLWLVVLSALTFALLARRVRGRADRDDPADLSGTSGARGGYAASLRMLRREPALQASSLINLNLNTVVLLGNSFYPIALDVPAERLPGLVLTLLLCRDLTSVAAGPFFGRVVSRIGLRGAVTVSGVCAVAGLAAVGLAGNGFAGVAAGAVLHGLAGATGIGATNLLATAGSSAGGTGLRLAATNYLNGVGMLVLPVVFGALLDVSGPGGVFLAGACVSAAMLAGVLALTPAASPARAR